MIQIVYRASGSFLSCFSLLKSLSIFAKLWHPIDHFFPREFHEGREEPRTYTQANGRHMHAERHWSRSKQCAKEARIASHEVLNVELGEKDDPEPEVLEGALEDVELTAALVELAVLADFLQRALLDLVCVAGHLVKYTAIDHVEEIHHGEALEHEGLV